MVEGTPRGAEGLARLAGRIESRRAVVGVLGLGYVGLPLFATVAGAGYPVVGVERDPERLRLLRAGRSYTVDVSDARAGELAHKPLSEDAGVFADADVILICVPTPLKNGAPDLAPLRTAVRQVGEHLAPGRLVVLESTVYPGTTEEIVRPLLERRSGLAAGTDFSLAYSPERMNPGRRRLADIPKIVSGLTDQCRDLAASFYGSIVTEVVPTTSPRTAEMAKMIENTFRHVNVALVNELAVAARDLDIDIWSALRAAATKPFGYLAFWPGPGAGGHCIPIDPSYLSWLTGSRRGHGLPFVDHANRVNRAMPGYVADRVEEVLAGASRGQAGGQILVLGAAYKGEVADVRESPALAVMKLLHRRGHQVAYHDPFVPEVSVDGLALRSRELTPELLSAVECAVVLTPHRSVDYELVVRTAPLVFDARGVTVDIDGPNVVTL